MYNDYEKIIELMLKYDLSTVNFKNNYHYNGILEHVSYEQGIKYLELILNEFPYILSEDIIEFIKINDKIGFPKKYTYNIFNIQIDCSPSSLRYIYHSLLILKNYKNKNTNEIVELGCGYGGLFLAISFFSKILGINIEKYYMIDLPVVCKLISKYLEINKEFISIKYEILESTNYGSDIKSKDIFFISNYCFSEIDKIHRYLYVKNLFPKINSGFVIWQTSFSSFEESDEIFKNKTVNEERPQTGNEILKNYFICF
jgi:hypothetical protein